MKVGVFALTVEGMNLALKVAFQASKVGIKADAYFPEQMLEMCDGDGADVNFYGGKLKEVVSSVFGLYDSFVFIMASGIVVRTIAPLIGDKRTDPAVVVMDEKGRFTIPLLSGHLGGANDLANVLAQLLGAIPVITTATDVQGKIAPDVLAREFKLVIEPWKQLVRVNSLLANNGSVGWFIQSNLTVLKDKLSDKGLGFQSLDGLNFEAITREVAFSGDGTDKTLSGKIKALDGAVILTNKILPLPKKPFLFLRPRNIIAGVGCKRGIPAREIIAALESALAELGLSSKSLAKITSVDIKKDEKGILEAAEYFQVTVEFFDREALQNAYQVWPGLTESELVRQKIGVDGVCEPAALLGGKATSLLKPKQSYQGITIALSEDTSWWLE